jgi:hypothetical protein
MKILKRLYCILLSPVFLLNITLSTLSILPYWLLTGKNVYESLIHTMFRDYYLDKLESLRKS